MKKSPLRFLLIILLLSFLTDASTKAYMKRSRGQGLFHTEGANTVGQGNIWFATRAIGFLWDDKFDTLSGLSVPAIHGFIEARADAGIFNCVSILVESRPVSYPWDNKLQFGNIQAGIKATYPNNADIRLFGIGGEFRYLHSFLKNFNSIAGYRSGGTGFSPEGIILEGGSLQAKVLFDFDLIAYNSKFPFQIMANCGMRVSLDAENRDLSSYLFSLGVSYSGLEFEGFIEYSIEALFNSVLSPAVVEKKWWTGTKKWEVAFSENPMYLTFGGRYRFGNGATATLCAPLLLSTNYGTAMIEKDKQDLHTKPGSRPEVKDTFDPWYAKWKVIIELSIPIKYTHTAAQMRRNFLLLKNKKPEENIDIDRQLNKTKKDSNNQKDGAEEDYRRRLEKIKKQREKIDDTE